MDRSLSYDDYNAIRSREYFGNDGGDSDWQSDDIEQISDKDYNDRIEDNREKLQTWEALPPDVYTKGMIFRGQIPTIFRHVFQDRDPRTVRLIISRATDLRWGTQRTFVKCFPRRHRPLVAEIPDYMDPPAPIWTPLLGTYYTGTSHERKVYYQWRDHPERREEIHFCYTNLLREKMFESVTETLMKIGFSNQEIEILMDPRKRAESEVLSRTSVLTGCQIESQALMHQFRMARLTGRRNPRKRKKHPEAAPISNEKKSRFENTGPINRIDYREPHPKELMDIRDIKFNPGFQPFQGDVERKSVDLDKMKKFQANFRSEIDSMNQQQVEFRSDIQETNKLNQFPGLTKRQRQKMRHKMKKLQIEFRGDQTDIGKMVVHPEEGRIDRQSMEQFPIEHRHELDEMERMEMERLNKFQVEFRTRQEQMDDPSLFMIDNRRNSLEKRQFHEGIAVDVNEMDKMNKFQFQFRNPNPVMDNPTQFRPTNNRGYEEMNKPGQMLVDQRSKSNKTVKFRGEDWMKPREFDEMRDFPPYLRTRGAPMHGLEAETMPPSTEPAMAVRKSKPDDRLWDRRSPSPPAQLNFYGNRPNEEMPIHEMTHAINTMKDLAESQRIIENLDAFQVMQMKKAIRELRDLSNQFVDSSTRDSRHTRDFFKAAVTDVMELILSPYTFRSLPRAIAAWNVVEANGLQVPPALQESWSRLIPSRASVRAALWKSDSKVNKYEELRAEFGKERENGMKHRAPESRETPDYLEPPREMMAQEPMRQNTGFYRPPDCYWGQWKSVGDMINK